MVVLTEKLYRPTMYESTALRIVQNFVNRWNIPKKEILRVPPDIGDGKRVWLVGSGKS
jgi:hypothetical protein